MKRRERWGQMIMEGLERMRKRRMKGKDERGGKVASE